MNLDTVSMTASSLDKIDLVHKLRRLANAIEKDEPFEMQLQGEKIQVAPALISQWQHAEDNQHHLDIRLTW